VIRLWAMVWVVVGLGLAQFEVQAQRNLAPISGRVLNDSDGTPIAGAVVHYRGSGGYSENDVETNPTSLQGQVTTGADGSYQLPNLPPGQYNLRASAPGFFAAHDWVQPLPAGIKPEPPPLPRGYKGPPIHFAKHDGVLRLRPDALRMQAMLDDSLAAFALPRPGFTHRTYFNTEFSADGNRVGFITLDSTAQANNRMITRCVAWTYDLADHTLVGADMPGSPITAKVGTDFPPGFCGTGNRPWEGFQEGYATTWVDKDFYVVDIKSEVKEQRAQPAVNVFVMRGSTIEQVVGENRPAVVQAMITDRVRVRKFVAEDADSVTTKDGLFKVTWELGEGRSTCVSLELTNLRTKRSRTIELACGGLNHYLVDHEKDLLIYMEEASREFPNRFAQMAVLDLKTGRRREFPVPMVFHMPEFLKDFALNNGGVLVAYSMEGDCDPSTSDYSQPSQAEGELGNTRNQSSVCFVTIPQAEASVAANPVQKKTKP
jgi:hypothetical protein